MHEPDAVEQEDGYLSPSPSLAQWDSPDISSPVRPGPSAGRRKPASWDEDDHNADDDDDFFDADVLSSPPLHRHLRQSASTSGSVTVERTVTRALPLVPLRAPRFGSGGSTHTSRRTTTSSRTTSTDSFDSRHGHGPNGRQEREGREDADRNGPDLRDTFDDWEEVTSGGEDEEWFAAREGSFHSTASSTPGPVTPSEPEDAGADEDGDVKMMRAPSRCAADEGSSEELEEDDSDNDQRAEAAARNASTKVAHGWWAKWARSGTSADGLHSNAVGGASASGGSSDRVHEHAQLRRRETTITPDGRQRPLGRTIAPPGWGPRSAPPLAKRTGSLTHEGEDLRATGRTRLTFTASTDVVVTGATPSKVGRSSSLKLKAQAQAHAQSRWTPACR
ncbi:hypothetical protein C8Q73DRAFT_743235 [Cubamyces lactineus]|nr:hypothetical protein C8Q73DRAFT_743235 [Cubamyces lactineus]